MTRRPSAAPFRALAEARRADPRSADYLISNQLNVLAGRPDPPS